jgi:hypothetical protein
MNDIIFITYIDVLVYGRDRVIGRRATRPEGWPRNDDQCQKVTESPVEINLRLMKVIALHETVRRFGA